MDIVFILFGDIVVDDTVYILHVNATGCHVRGNQDGKLSVPIALHCFFPLALANIAVDTVTIQTCAMQLIGKALAHMLGIAEDHNPFIALSLN